MMMELILEMDPGDATTFHYRDGLIIYAGSNHCELKEFPIVDPGNDNHFLGDSDIDCHADSASIVYIHQEVLQSWAVLWASVERIPMIRSI